MAVQSFSELFSGAYSAYKEHFRLFFELGSAFIILPAAIFFIATLLAKDSTSLLIIKGVQLIVLSLTQLFFTVAVIKVLTAHRITGEPSFFDAFNHSKQYFWKAVMLSILLFLALFALALAFIIPAIIFHVFWIFAIYALVIDDVSVMRTFEHSTRLVKGRWWQVFGNLFLMGLLMIIIAFIVLLIQYLIVLTAASLSLIFTSQTIFLIGTSISLMISLIVSVLTLPLTLSFIEHMYVNLRDETPGIYDRK